MAIINSLAIGAAKNSIGQITYSTVKGRTIGRQKPVHVSNPRTSRQVAQREKLANLVAAWRAYFFQTRPYWTVISNYGSAYNEFVSKNMQLADQITIVDGEITDIPDGIYVSNGKYGVAAIDWKYTTNDMLQVKINDIQLREELTIGDELILILFDPTGEVPNQIRHEELIESQIATLKTGGYLDLITDVDRYYIAVVYYSSARGVSSTARLEYLPPNP